MTTISYTTKILAMLVCILAMAGCTSLETITVYGKPDDNIYTPDKQYLATIQDSGEAQIRLSSDAYYAFLYSNDGESDQWIPFGLDIRKNQHSGARTALYAGLTIDVVGLIGMGVGSGLIEQNESGGAPMLWGSLGVTGAGLAMWAPAVKRLNQLAYQYNFGYMKTQKANSDIELAKPEATAEIE